MSRYSRPLIYYPMKAVIKNSM